MSGRFTQAQKRAGLVVSALLTAFSRSGVSGPLAVALLTDGSSVFCTADGLGVLPHATSLPENVFPLSEYQSVNSLFRADMTGCVNPGHVLSLAAELGLIGEVRAIVSTDKGSTEGVTYVTPDTLKGAPVLPLVVSRDQLQGIDPAAVDEVKAELLSAWGITEVPERLEAFTELSFARWEVVGNPAAPKALITALLSDVEDSIARGHVRDAAYLLLQALLVEVPES